MSIRFQSFRSSSAGNCLALWTGTSSILIDCGIRAQRECRDILEQHRSQAGSLDAVVVSHAHGDHVACGALRVLARQGIRVVGDARVIDQVRDAYGPDLWDERPPLRAFAGPTCEVGDFSVTPVRVPHDPDVPTFGFLIAARGKVRTRRIVVCTDFYDYAGLLPRLAGADFIFVEANHDRGLLKKYPNYRSRYHLNNVKAASLLHHAVRLGGAAPKAVMLGHLSEERNRRALAIDEVRRMFERTGTKLGFQLDAAPARRPSEVIEI